MRLLILGNSHVGALKRGWEGFAAEDRDDTDIRFAAARGALMQAAKLDRGVLSSQHPALRESLRFTYGDDTIDLSSLSPDAILVYGMGLRPDFSAWYLGVRGRRYSRACQAAALRDSCGAFGYDVALRLRAQVDVPVFVSEPIRARQETAGDPGHGDIGPPRAAAPRPLVLAALETANDLFGTEFGISAFLQPAETLETAELVTRTEFTRGSRRLAIGRDDDDQLHGEADFAHMNDHFGQVFLKAFLREVARAVSASRSARAPSPV